MKAPAYTFIIQWFLVYSYHVDIQVQKEQAPEFFDEDEDMIEYRYSIDVAVLLKENFQDLLNCALNSAVVSVMEDHFVGMN